MTHAKPVVREADALAPAGARDMWQFIKSLPSAPKRYQVIATLISIIIAMRRYEYWRDSDWPDCGFDDRR